MGQQPSRTAACAATQQQQQSRMSLVLLTVRGNRTTSARDVSMRDF